MHVTDPPSLGPATSDPPTPATPAPAAGTMRSRAELQAAAELLKALANPLRLAILEELHTAPRCVHELVSHLGVSQPLVSQHLRILRTARLLTTERRGKEIVYTLADDHVAHIVADAIEHANQEGSEHEHRTHHPR